MNNKITAAIISLLFIFLFVNCSEKYESDVDKELVRQRVEYGAQPRTLVEMPRTNNGRMLGRLQREALLSRRTGIPQLEVHERVGEMARGDEYTTVVNWTFRSTVPNEDLTEGDFLILNPLPNYVDGVAGGRPQWLLKESEKMWRYLNFWMKRN